MRRPRSPAGRCATAAPELAARPRAAATDFRSPREAAPAPASQCEPMAPLRLESSWPQVEEGPAAAGDVPGGTGGAPADGAGCSFTDAVPASPFAGGEAVSGAGTAIVA